MNLDERYAGYTDEQLVLLIDYAEAMVLNPRSTIPQVQAVEASMAIMRKEAKKRLDSYNYEDEDFDDPRDALREHVIALAAVEAARQEEIVFQQGKNFRPENLK
jgi:uncharacterized protein YecE (DUF72 family)